MGDDGARRAARLGERTWAEAEHRPLLLVPLGSCEQHGPHLPLDTDTRIATALADAAAARLGGAAVAPAVGMTASGEHAGFAGTLSIGLTAALFASASLMLAQLPWYALPLMAAVPGALLLSSGATTGSVRRRALILGGVGVAAARAAAPVRSTAR